MSNKIKAGLVILIFASAFLFTFGGVALRILLSGVRP